MSHLLSTAELVPRERFDFWKDAVSQASMPVEVDTPQWDDFDATITFATAGPLELMRMAHPPLRVSRTARLIRRTDPEVLHLALTVGGHQRISQGSNEAFLQPGDLTLYHSSRVFHTVSDDRFGREGALVLVIPSALLPLPFDDVLATRLPPDEPLVGLVIAHMMRMQECVDRLDSAQAARFSMITLDLVSLMVAERTGAGAAVSADSQDRARFARVQSFIEQHLAERWLDPASVARAHHMSLRALHRLFHDHGLTVAGWIRTRRLENCRRDLGDLRLRWSVAAIAARWGLDPHSFGRAFRSAYGMSPTEYRDQFHA